MNDIAILNSSQKAFFAIRIAHYLILELRGNMVTDEFSREKCLKLVNTLHQVIQINSDLINSSVDIDRLEKFMVALEKIGLSSIVVRAFEDSMPVS